jgi:RNase H-fold protein (predicted Holliday junction resolvase)
MKAKPRDTNSRILALDLRARRIGYAAFETPHRLLEFGVTRFKSRHVALVRLTRIMQRVKPTKLVLRKIPTDSARNTSGMRRVFRLAWLLARRSSVAVSMARETHVKQHFSDQGATTKYQTALFLVRLFTELEWRLPPPRKAWQREHRNMSIFDAAALGVTYLASTQEH